MLCLRVPSRTNPHALVAMLLFAAISAAVITDAGTLKAQTVSWIQVGYSSAPSARQSPGIAYDVVRHSTVLFGGADGSSIYGDTWTWNGTWRSMSPATSPSPRQGPAIAFDGAAGNIVLFGGSPTAPVGYGTAFGDTWTWDGINWTQQFPALSPPARVWSSMVYDPVTKIVVLFSGTNTPGGDDAFSDTWAWDGVTKNWTELDPISHPPGRTMNQLVYDPANGTVVLFGGVTTALTPLNDTWTWNGSNWRQHFPASSPAPRNGPALAYDPALGAVVLFGGAVGTCCFDNLNDTWTWNGRSWTEIYPANPLPPARNAPAMDYDSLRKVILVFGGARSGPELDDTWFLAVSP
ncbi:MAG: kelch repeat-containing protein [Bryobacteraceae bacterium]|jgi:hypothetical protein